jgi:gamma-glutamylcyclotransferase (GGCT)/AIG2-like uncharacterized protein YtfP
MERGKITKIGVYGSLLTGLGNHGLLSRQMEAGNARLVGEDRIKGFDLYAVSSYPGIKRSENPEKEVKVEVYEVNDAALANVRALEGYNPHSSSNFFYDEVQTPTEDHGEISVYLYMPRVREEALVENGDWREYKKK